MTTGHNYRLALGICIVAMTLLAGCRSSKRAAREADTTTGATVLTGGTEENRPTTTTTAPTTTTTSSGKKKSQTVERINKNRQTATGIRGKMNINLKAGSSPLSASGTIKMKRNEIIQLSVTALGLVELGRMELTPDYLFIQDRYHKKYIKARWNEISSLQSTGVDFNTFQALFWNELFVPGEDAVPSSEDFKESDGGKRAHLQPTNQQKNSLTDFYTNEDRDLVYQTTMQSTDHKVRFDGQCKSWTKLDGKPFPTNLRLIITANNKSYSAELDFTRLQVDESMGDLSTSVSEGRYTRVTLEEVLQGLHL